MTPAPTYRVRDWDRHFETSESRKRKGPLAWVGIPCKHSGRGFNRLKRQPEWTALYGCWVLILEVAAKCPTRGVLADEDGPFAAVDVADKVGMPQELVQRCFDLLTDQQAGIMWLEIAADSGTPQQTPADASRSQQTSSPPDITGPDITGPDQRPEQVSDSGFVGKSPKKPPKTKSSVFDWLNDGDMRDVGKLIAWHKRAANCPNPVIGPTESDRLHVVAAAVKSWDKADNPKALFAWIVAKRKWDRITELDEDTAAKLIKDYLRGGPRKPERHHGDCQSAADAMPGLLASLGVTP